MVRRSTADRSPRPGVYGAGFAPEAGDLAHGRGGREDPSARWRGAGGRWLVWVFRGVVWLVLIVIGYRGVTAIVTGETSPPPSAPGGATHAFPVALASAYALQFGQVYLNANPASANLRATELAAFLPAGASPELGWNGSGSLQLQSEQVAGVQVRDAHQAVVTLLARVSGRLMELGVPIYASGGGLVVSGDPAWLPAPPKAALPSASQGSSDPGTQGLLMKQLPAFFQAYASGDQTTLARYLAPGTRITGLHGRVAFGSLTAITVPQGGAVRHVVATVTWRVPGPTGAASQGPSAGTPSLQASYGLTIVKLSGTWYVRYIGPSTFIPGQP